MRKLYASDDGEKLMIYDDIDSTYLELNCVIDDLDAEDDEEAEKIQAKPSKQRKERRASRCGNCGQAGHTRPTCSENKKITPVSDLNEDADEEPGSEEALGKTITQVDRGELVVMKNNGYSSAKAARELGLDLEAVNNVWPEL